MKPKWQRARVVIDRDDPETVGAYIWVLIGAPRNVVGTWGRVDRAVSTNLRWHTDPMAWGIEYLETARPRRERLRRGR